MRGAKPFSDGAVLVGTATRKMASNEAMHNFELARKIAAARECSTMAVRGLPKAETRVRFPSLAPRLEIPNGAAFAMKFRLILDIWRRL